MGVGCDRCSFRGTNLDDYENFFDAGGVMVVCHECATELRNDK